MGPSWAELRAVVVVNRCRAIVGYNAAIVALALGLGRLTASSPPTRLALTAAGLYALGAVFLKMQASIADAIHDREVDASNPEKSVIAAAVATLGVERAWTLLVVETVLGMSLVAAAALLSSPWLLPTGAAIALLGFGYSYPPRFKERGVWNHFVTTGVDVGLLLLPVAALVGGITPMTAVVAGVAACYGFGYHVLHQAADIHHDRKSGLGTFASRIGVWTAVLVATGATAAAAGFSVALGYPIAALAAGGVTVHYARLSLHTVDLHPKRACSTLSRRFSIAWVATLLNGALALAVWRRVLGQPILHAVEVVV